MASFREMLSGGHPNSLGRTDEVVELVLQNETRFAELFNCYASSDEVVRLRTSSAMKRIEAARHDLLIPYIDRLIEDVGTFDQASAQWTLAQLFHRLRNDMAPRQHEKALARMKTNLESHNDWIVLNWTIETLAEWATEDTELRTWLRPHLVRLANDTRKSVAKRAAKKLHLLYGE